MTSQRHCRFLHCNFLRTCDQPARMTHRQGMVGFSITAELTTAVTAALPPLVCRAVLVAQKMAWECCLHVRHVGNTPGSISLRHVQLVAAHVFNSAARSAQHHLMLGLRPFQCPSAANDIMAMMSYAWKLLRLHVHHENCCQRRRVLVCAHEDTSCKPFNI